MGLHKWNLFSLYWLLWLGVGFCVPEMFALWRHESYNTFSDNVWHLEKAYGPNWLPWHWSFLHLMITFFMIWLTGHFAFRIWR